MSENEARGAWFAFAVIAGFFLLLILCEGDPDIIDGLAKRANAVDCRLIIDHHGGEVQKDAPDGN